MNCAQTHEQHRRACTIFAPNVRILEGTKLPLPFVLEFCFRTRVGDIPAASSKVK